MLSHTFTIEIELMERNPSEDAWTVLPITGILVTETRDTSREISVQNC